MVWALFSALVGQLVVVILLHVLVSKYLPYSIGQIIFAIDTIVLTLIVLIFQDIRLVLYTLMMVGIASKMIEHGSRWWIW